LAVFNPDAFARSPSYHEFTAQLAARRPNEKLRLTREVAEALGLMTKPSAHWPMLT